MADYKFLLQGQASTRIPPGETNLVKTKVVDASKSVTVTVITKNKANGEIDRTGKQEEWKNTEEAKVSTGVSAGVAQPKVQNGDVFADAEQNGLNKQKQNGVIVNGHVDERLKETNVAKVTVGGGKFNNINDFICKRKLRYIVS